MSQSTPGMPEPNPSQEAEETQSKRSTRRRRGRRGGRGRNAGPSNNATDVAMGMMNPPEPDWAEDEQQVSQQLHMLMTPRGAEGEMPQTPPVPKDPQLTYTPPASIESHDSKPDREPVSAKTFKKTESPVQALMATVGSMAILAAIYHFGVWEGSQSPTGAPTAYASVAAPPVLSIAPDPMPSRSQIESTSTTAEIPTAEYVPPSAESMMTTPPQIGGSGQAETSIVASIPVPAPKPTPLPVAPVDVGPSGLYLQVGALKDAAAARGLEHRLRTAGFVIEVLKASDDGLIRVIVGPYDESVGAEADARELSRMRIRSFPKRF